jgi:broad specificity phosphatase PhoE
MNGLLFIRHAETDLAGTFCGHSDPLVNAHGHEQIHALMQSLHDESIDAIYSSDLRRAVTTANALAEAFHAPVTTNSVLREIHFGQWEGLPWSEIEHRDPAYARRWTEAFPHLPAPGGELFAHFEARVRSEVDRLLLLAQDKRISVVTHAGVMRLVLQTYCGCTAPQAWEQTASYCCTFPCVPSLIPHEVTA